MPDLTYMNEMQIKEIAYKTEHSIRLLFDNIQKTMEYYRKDKVDKFVIDKAIAFVNTVTHETNANYRNPTLVKSNKMKLDSFARLVEFDNIRTSSILALFYNNCHEADRSKRSIIDGNKNFFKETVDITPTGIYDSIYWMHNVDIMDLDSGSTFKQKSIEDFEITPVKSSRTSNDGGPADGSNYLNLLHEASHMKLINPR